MKASVHLLIGCVALGSTLPAIQASAAVTTTAGVAAAIAATGQTGAETDPRRQADELLRQARKAIKEGAFDQADELIGRAERTGVKYDPLTARFVDTPEKLRKLLVDERAKAQGPEKPSSRFPALLSRASEQPQQQAIPSDPFQAQQQRTNVVDRLTEDDKAKAVGFIQEARAALQRGDKLAAMSAYQKAIGLKASFGPNEDSPQRLAADLQAAGVDVSRLSAAPANPAASPYALRPSDITPSDDRLPLLPRSNNPAGLPAGAPTPYGQPAGNNPLDPNLLQNASAPPQAQAPSAYPATGNQYQPVAEAARPAASPARLPGNVAAQKAEVQRLIAEARMALDKGDFAAAQRMVDQAQSMNVPEQAYGPEETRPWQLALEIQKVASRREGVVPAGGIAPMAGGSQYPVAQGAYVPAADTTRLQPASSQATLDNRPTGASQAHRIYEEGLRALESQDRAGAMEKFREAWALQEQLDPETLQQLKDKLTFLAAAPPPGAQPVAAGEASPLEQVGSEQDLLRQKLAREVHNELQAAEKLAATDPRGALVNLKKVRERISGAEIGAADQKRLLTLVDKGIVELDKYVEQNKSTIENEERNKEIRAEMVRDQELTIETQNKLAQMVEEFNKLLDERRYAEAEVVAKQAREISPENPTVTLMVEKSKLARNIAEEMSIGERSADNFIKAMHSVGESAIPFDDRNPLVFGDVRTWNQLTRDRARLLQEKSNLSPAEMEIQRSLSKPVEARFDNRPLQEVLDTLGKMAGVNVYLDPQGMHAEGVSSDTPVSLNLTQPISLKSALNLILEPLSLSYVIQNEVLRITSEQTRDSNTYAKVYYVADLVVPIPNFVPSYNMGLPGALKESLNSLGYGNGIRPSMAGPLTVAADDPANQQQGAVNPTVLAQAQMQGGPLSGLGGTRGPQPLGAGPGGLGGGVQADFDPLIELITTTIAPQSWDEVGGPGSVSGFDTNLSLVVSQTQDVHEKIADLLEQLRRLQDLQVTIEVRFITIADNFFERIGVDFDFAVDDNTNLNNVIDLLPGQNDGSGNFAGNTPFPSPFDDTGPSLTFGLSPTGPTADLDFAFNQGSNSVTPAFGGFDANSAATFGFAILSDIEVFFLLNAAQGDNRTNVLQAPKVTLFNGQQAFVSDTSQRPFVTSVIPVVGDFAAAHQPVIVVLSEGTSLSVQAVVSSDRRFVRLTLVPFFSRIGDVETFTFNGKVTTDSGTTTQDPSDPDANVVNNQTRTVEGTTVQLPTFAFTTVVTTVSVPDGGTVLLGGIKRLREGRVERGVPLLSKIPYVSRLFRNVAIGRDAQSLMMMVTPRIIIQEEEEEKLGIELEP